MNNSPHLLSVVIPVFRDGARGIAATNAMLRQSLPDGVECEIIVVDDGSGDGTSAQLSECNDARVRIMSLPFNQGRSSARNAGVTVASGKFVVFMDCDCIPDAGFLAAHFAALSSGSVASTGHVTGDGTGFWSRYQCEASMRRKLQHSQGASYAGSSQNMAVRRAAFEAIGGFDKGYRRYGFEDRDFLLRISEIGRIAWADDAIVHHQDHLALSHISLKMREAGEYTSAQFSGRHPDAYRRLGYASIDTHMSLFAKLVAPACIWVASLLATGFDKLRCERWLPYALAKQIVRVTSALSYLSGTARRS